MSNLHSSLLLLLAAGCLQSVSGQAGGPGCKTQFLPEGSEWQEAVGCEPYDGSKVPDCSVLVDPATGQPFYMQHEWNCSLFWKCAPTPEHEDVYTACLFSCPACGESPLCQGSPALAFNCGLSYPWGPVCDWPVNVECTTAECNCEDWQTCEDDGSCTGECTTDEHCPDLYECEDNVCEYEGECDMDEPCDLSDGLCVEGEYATSCQYCSTDDLTCNPGCGHELNCPDGYTCHHHQCEPFPCQHSCEDWQTCEDEECTPQCTTDAHCAEGQSCEDGECSSGSGEECDIDEDLCDLADGVCVEGHYETTCNYCSAEGFTCEPGCGHEDNCPDGFTCHHHKCLPFGPK